MVFQKINFEKVFIFSIEKKKNLIFYQSKLKLNKHALGYFINSLNLKKYYYFRKRNGKFLMTL